MIVGSYTKVEKHEECKCDGNIFHTTPHIINGEVWPPGDVERWWCNGRQWKQDDYGKWKWFFCNYRSGV